MTATEDIIDLLGKKIVQGEFVPYEKLPTERDLAVQYGVARGRVREALRGLAMAGLIEIKRGSGTFVRHPDQWVDSLTVRWAFGGTDSSMEDLLDVRDVLEKGIYEQAYDLCNNLDLENINAKLDDIYAASSQSNPVFADSLDAFDLQLAQISRNVLFLRLFQMLLILRRQKVEHILSVKGSREQSLQLREQLYWSFKNRDKEQALMAIDTFFAKAKSFAQALK
ncbi:GntR family transcriptional regulator [Vibrio sp. CK2-1]|uniref:FadR/GntR family transcriptional regulator n=1 Tax=Vibrio sp. CK2-1 TaxID=2912249 RepID=UPI001F016506|nr:GntR family transcriptional regulator [Vibrio sp. CK2-1]MCF7352972.1 GntR family transcriptional regulator [Vibrio sp. CK2-1]